MKSVSAYHAAFAPSWLKRFSIPFLALKHALLSVMKPAVYQVVMKDPMSRGEFEHLDVVVKAVKEAEYLLSIMSGSTGDDTPRLNDRLGHCRDHKRRPAPLGSKEAKKPGKHVPYDVASEKAKWMKKGCPERVFDSRHAGDRCYIYSIQGLTMVFDGQVSKHDTRILLDSGAACNAISAAFVRMHALEVTSQGKAHPQVRLANGTGVDYVGHVVVFVTKAVPSSALYSLGSCHALDTHFGQSLVAVHWCKSKL